MPFVTDAVRPTQSLVNFGSLALLVPLLKKLDVAQIIDRHVPTDPQAEFSHGAVLSVLLAARLHSPTALVNVQEWAGKHGVEYLCNIPPEKLNDDRLGRALDAFFEHRHAVLAEITCHVLRHTNLSLERCHFDPTHLILYGAYENSKPRSHNSLDELLRNLDEPAHITRGYQSKYKILQLGLTSVVDDLGAVPVACHLYDGNRNGHTGVKEQYHLMRNFLRLPEGLLFVSDRGTCSAEHLATLKEQEHFGLCAGQWKDFEPVYERHMNSLQWHDAAYLSREQQRRRACGSKLPLEDYRYAVLKHKLTDPKTGKDFDCRVVFVHSSAAAKESKDRREENIAKIRDGLEAFALKLVKAHPRTTTESVTRGIAALLDKKGAANLFHWDLIPLTADEQAALPKPQKGRRLQSHRLEFSFDPEAAKADARHDGISTLVTTAPLTWTGDELLTEYKRQTYVERGNHELKTPLAVTPIFLKNSERVEALVSLLFLALQAHMTLERLYRQKVPASAPESEKRMTAERILRMFSVCGLIVEQQPYGDLVRVVGMSPLQQTIMTQLSLSTPREILRENLPPPPTP